MKKYKNALILLLFLTISIFVLSKIVFNDKLIGRTVDFPVPPVSYLVKNVYLQNFYTWTDTCNGGGPNPFTPTLIPINSILYFPILFGAEPWFIARYQIILTLFLAMVFSYILSRKILEDYDIEQKNKIILSVLGGLFFTLNNYFFCEIIFGSNVVYLTFSFVPLLIYSIISYKKTKKRKYFILSLTSLVIISSTLQHLVLAYILMIILWIIYGDIKVFIKLGLLHFFLSFYWILPCLYVLPEIRTTANYTSNLLVSAPKILDSLINKEYFFNRNIYNSALNSDLLSSFWIFNASFLVIASFFCLLKIDFLKKAHKKIVLAFSVIFLMSLLFMKGAHEPFGEFVLYLYTSFPIFGLYRSLQHYTSFYVIAISILFIFSGIVLIKHNKKFTYLLILLVIINAMPWWYTQDLGTQNIVSTGTIPSYFGQFYLTDGNEKMYSLNKLPLDFSILTIPPGYSIEFSAVGKNNVKSQGGDAGLAFGNKNFYSTDSQSPMLKNMLDNMEKDMYSDTDFFNKYKTLFSILNIKYFILREDTRPLFSKYTYAFNIENIKQAINNSMIFKSVTNEDFITILENEYFLPHFYAPRAIVVSNQSTDSLLSITSQLDYNIPSAIFFENQNENKTKIIQDIPSKIANTPILEFKKIDPTEYRIRVHNATNPFVLVFSESFDDGWKAYLTKSEETKIKPTIVDNYKPTNDQATKEELIQFINNGWITSLGKDFISKNFLGTIQNDNLPNGGIYETWFTEPIDNNENHLIANGYANSWVIDPAKLCNQNDKCIRNSDGSYDFEIVVVYWPQRLFYLGFIISGTTLIAYMGYLIYDWRKKRARYSAQRC